MLQILERPQYHRTLERQLKKIFGRNAMPPEGLLDLLAMVSESYQHHDEDRQMLERSIDLSSQELIESNASLLRKKAELERTIEELRNTQIELAASQELARLSNALRESNEELQSQREELATTIEELKGTQSQLIHAEKMSSLGQLTAGIAHEINNPVNFVYVGIQALAPLLQEAIGILGQVERLGTDASKVDAAALDALLSANRQEHYSLTELQNDIKQMIDSIKVGAERTSEIVRGLRIFARTDTDELQYADLKELLSAGRLILGNRLKDRIMMHVEADDIPPIPCYPGLLNQVIINIISNATDAIERNGNIHVAMRNAGEKVLISIKDDGPGIPKAVMGKIFDPFFTTKEIGKGTGLGLSISYGIIEKHSGRIWVESEEGMGACFFIELPKLPPKE